MYAILSEERDALQKYLADHGVATIIYYPQPLHLQKVFAGLGLKIGDFPVAERLAERYLSLPMHPHLADTQVEYVVDQLVAAVE